MHDIILGASVTGGALYHHFPSKKDLALAVITERVSSEIANTWIATLKNASNTALGILAAFDQTADLLDRQGSVSGCPLGNLATELSLADAELRRAIETEYQGWRSALAERLADDEERGLADFVQGDATGWADVIVAMFTGAMSIAKAEQNPMALRACARRLRVMMRLSVPETD